MPIMDGWEATKILRSMEKRGDLKKLPPIIGCTAHSSEIVLYKCKEAGMDDLIVKPCPKDIILRKIESFIN